MSNRTILTSWVLALSLLGCGKSVVDSEQSLSALDSLISTTGQEILTASKTVHFPSYHPNFPVPPSETNLFELSQDYPDTFDLSQSYPWTDIDFRKKPNQYLDVVLKYCLAGNIEVDFKGQDNEIRRWYHAPWLHAGTNGREYKHGLTRERATPKFEIHRNQDVILENWAVGMFNEPGGYTLGKVWDLADGMPNPSMSSFPEGTVSFKLLFTNGTVEKVPFLNGTLEWEANIYTSPSRTKRANSMMRLLQIDIAVKDKRAGEIGWIFGTFVYNGASSGKTVWDRMEPVGLSWGDDSNVTTRINQEGAFINGDLKESFINGGLVEDPKREYTNEAYLRHHGLGGRLNGPVDNPVSSCVSCHGRAGTYKNFTPLNPNSGRPMPMGNFSLSRHQFTVDEFRKYFSTISGGASNIELEGVEYITTDYSLQLSAGIRNYFQSIRDRTAVMVAAKSTKSAIKETFLNQQLPEVTRGEPQ